MRHGNRTFVLSKEVPWAGIWGLPEAKADA